MLAVIETHPVQYHAPVYRALQARFGVPVTAIYGSDFSVGRYRDAEFATSFAWDTDLLSGYSQRFLTRAPSDGVPDVSAISARGTRAALRAINPSAVLLVGYSPAFHRRAWYEAWRLGRPLLFRGETSDVAQSSNPMVDMAKQVGLRLAYQTCSRLLFIGSRSRLHYTSLGITDARLVFAPYCVDTSPFQSDDNARLRMRLPARAALGLDEEALVVMFAGKLSARKGVDLLPAAVALLPASLRSRVVLVFVGDGALRNDLEAAAGRSGVASRFVGFRHQRELSEAYHAADLLALPSRSAETWGLVVNEALHHGVPCAVSERVGCAPDLIDDTTGAVCPADSAPDLATALVKAAALAGRQETRDRCRQRAARYSVEEAAAGIAEAYRAVTVEAAVA
ncbi:MAG: glycosyltransferase family 4 protein [Acidobacteriota bacterium]